MRDAIIIPFTTDEALVITSDNSGAIGMKEKDTVKVPYETVGYFSFRVAVMENMSAGATPITVVLQNFCGEDAWEPLFNGIQRGLKELGMEQVSITGSTESNFVLQQSAVGVNVIGKKSTSVLVGTNKDELEVSLIGLPLVGDEVINAADKVVPLSICKQICELHDVSVWPVGSKGVYHELKRVCNEFDEQEIKTNIDLHKSGGPATSFLAFYPKEKSREIIEIAGKYLHHL